MDTHQQSRATADRATDQAFEESPGRRDAQTVAIDDLTPFPGNPRRGAVAAIKESLEQKGQYRPIVVRRQTMEVLAGNHTLQAAKELGWKEIASR
jgi:ParB-like chromosome segregation protein Spo0J